MTLLPWKRLVVGSIFWHEEFFNCRRTKTHAHNMWVEKPCRSQDVECVFIARSGRPSNSWHDIVTPGVQDSGRQASRPLFDCWGDCCFMIENVEGYMLWRFRFRTCVPRGPTSNQLLWQCCFLSRCARSLMNSFKILWCVTSVVKVSQRRRCRHISNGTREVVAPCAIQKVHDSPGTGRLRKLCRMGIFLRSQSSLWWCLLDPLVLEKAPRLIFLWIPVAKRPLPKKDPMLEGAQQGLRAFDWRWL